MSKVFIIAEAGVNHNGSLGLAKKLIDVAAGAGCSAVKFQTFKAERVVTPSAPKARYQIKNAGIYESQFEMLKRLELSEASHGELMAHCKRSGITFMSSPFDIEGINFLAKLGMRIFKIPSGEITNLPYLRRVGSLGKKIILSTGMANLGEIRDALNVLVKSGAKKKNITVLHCNTEYPTPYQDANLRAMITIRDTLKVKAGYSDHTPGIEVSIAAAALGAVVIEKHFTLDKNMKGPDHKSSLEPHELVMMVKAIRNIEEALGDGMKRPSASESKNKLIMRKSIVASRDVKKGEVFSEDNIVAKRPATGISPIQWEKILGRTATRDYKEDEAIKL